MNSQIQLIACYVLITILTGSLAILSVKHYHSEGVIAEQANVINLSIASYATLEATVSLQNAKVDQLKQEAERATNRALEAEARLRPVIADQEQIIADIRSDSKPKSCDQIRAKMLKDAMP